MALYETLVEAYDELFPPAVSTKDFIGLPHWPGAFAIDVGCATGAHAAMLAELGWTTLGIDTSERMIEAAIERNRAGGRASFTVGGMMDIDALMPRSSASLIMCAGNTLPHLHGIDDLREFVKKTAIVLEPGGRFVVQALNYAKILRDRPDSLPDIQAGRWTLKRSYSYRDDGFLDFATELSGGPGDEAAQRDSTRLWPFTIADISSTALAAGFSLSGLYSSWAKDAFDEASSNLLLLDFRSAG